MTAIRGARPIINSDIAEHYKLFSYKKVTLSEYSLAWKEWLTNTKTKTLDGLDNLIFSDYVAGTSQAFDHFVLRHSDRTILAVKGDFQYHACIGKFGAFEYIDYEITRLSDCIANNKKYAMLISFPFSDVGKVHPNFDKIMLFCTDNDIPVCIDLAYWGISKNVDLDINKYQCITEITCSLSKPFYALENHRVGIRFTRNYENDGVSMLNEVHMANNYSMSLGVHFMKRFDADWNWDTHFKKYNEVCEQEKLKQTDVVIFGLGDQKRHSTFNRGLKNNFRVCISDYLKDNG